MPRPIPVTEPFLPDFEPFVDQMRSVWERRHLTNHGPLVQKLEKRLHSTLELRHPVHCLANGGLGIQLSLRALGIRGKVITTPFSYVATTSCTLWENLRPVFADIEADSFGLNPSAVEARLDSDCEAILATHVYGNPCDVDELERVANRHGLALIFDAAHAFGVRYQGESLLNRGDLSIVSTHATKIFHTVEGGFVTGPHREAMEKIEWMRRFGHHGEEHFHGPGINAKMSEFHAAMGLAILPEFPEIQRRRAAICEAYDHGLRGAPGVRPAIKLRPRTEWNHAYYAVLFDSEALLLERLRNFHAAQVMPRRYFHPQLDRVFPFLSGEENPITSDISRRILCLPLHHRLTSDEIELVIALASGTPPSRVAL